MAKYTIGSGGFTMVPNGMIIDQSISSGALRFWVYISSKPDTWKFFDVNIAKELNCTVRTLARNRSELSESGYLGSIPREKEHGGNGGWDYFIGTEKGDWQKFQETLPDGVMSGATSYERPDKNVKGGPRQKCQGDPDKNVNHSNTNSNNTNSSIVATKVDDESNCSVKEDTETMLQAKAVCDIMISLMGESLEKFIAPTEATKKSWSKDIEKMIRLDGRTPDEIISVLTWIHRNPSGSFWIANIKSGSKLRHQFTTLWNQMPAHKSVKVNSKQRILEVFGEGVVFLTIKTEKEGAVVELCLYGEFSTLYDYRRNKHINKEDSVKIWAYIDSNLDAIIANKK